MISTSRKYGEVSIENDEFVIDMEPQVRMHFKRTFSRVSKSHAGGTRMAITPLNALELDWFMMRYPMRVSAAASKAITSGTWDYRRRQQDLERVRGVDYEPGEYELALPLREYQRLAVDMAMMSKHLLIGDDVGLGKYQPVDTPVLTPSGWREIGVLRPEDQVIGSTGQGARVLSVHPQGVKPSYRVTFSDGSSVEAGDEHLWTVRYRAGGRRWQSLLLTTKQLRERPIIRQTWPNGRTTDMDLSAVPLHLPVLSGPVEFDPVEVPLPGYVVGYLIADGSLAHGSPQAVMNSDDALEVMARFLADGCSYGKVDLRGSVTRITVLGSRGVIRDLGLDVLSKVKRIPPVYLRASSEERLALLQGLLDGDGSCSRERNRVRYHTCSPVLAENVRELVEGLGGIASVARYDRSREDKPDDYQVRIRLPLGMPPFTVSRKAERYKPGRHAHPIRTVKSVEYVRDVESVCIAVDTPDRLYVTEHCILTHNTPQGIAVFSEARARPALVVTLTHLPIQWASQIQKFMPGMRTHILRSSKPYDLSKNQHGYAMPFPDVIIANYHKLANWAEDLAGVVKTVIYDEAQELRRSESLKYAAAQLISAQADYQVGLTATPIYNYGIEVFNVLNALTPGCLGSKEEFGREWCGGEWGDKASISDPRAFGKFLREEGLMIRRTREEVGRELPACSVNTHFVEPEAFHLQKVSVEVAEMARLLLQEGGTGLEKMKAAGQMDYKLRRATGLSKAASVAAFAKLMIESGEKVVLFGWHREVYSIWKSQLAEFEPGWITGTESAKQKELHKQRFLHGPDMRLVKRHSGGEEWVKCPRGRAMSKFDIEKGTDLLIMSLRSGAGIDGLQDVCSVGIIGELDWSPGVHTQCIGRIHRDGQSLPVMIYVILVNEGSDPVMADVCQIKKMQLDGINDPDADDLIEELVVDQDRMKRMAREYLERVGEAEEEEATRPDPVEVMQKPSRADLYSTPGGM